ncbi:MAG: TIGR04086 family membrane protein [Sedimentibacter sp.]|uniref:TIGR04086 family membrane protein n=1 Tax=Sedimentibacter sp. TaxID=1960295 RepID=UPI0031586F1C
MNIGRLLRYSLYLIILLLLVFLLLTLYMYFFSSNPTAEIAYTISIPVCIFIVALLYSRSTGERGLLRGIELWIVYFALVLLMKVAFNFTQEINILHNMLYLPASILGGVLGVNMKQKSVGK